MNEIKNLSELKEVENLANVRLTNELYSKVSDKQFQLEDVFSFRKPIYGTLKRLHEIMEVRGMSNPENHRFDRFYISEVEK